MNIESITRKSVDQVLSPKEIEAVKNQLAPKQNNIISEKTATESLSSKTVLYNRYGRKELLLGESHIYDKKAR